MRSHAEEMFLRRWLREDTEGRVEEVGEIKKRQRMERIAVDCKRMCFDFCSSILENPCEESGGADVGDCGNDCEVTGCVPVRVFDLVSS